MTNRELRGLEREGTGKLNALLKRGASCFTYKALRRAYLSNLANAETRRRVRAEAKKRGYKLTRFGG